MSALRTGDLVAIVAPPGPIWLDHVRRAWDAGAAILPVDHRLSEPAQRAVIVRAAATVLIADDGITRTGDGRRVEDEIGLAIATSGSTGEPATVLLSRAALLTAVLASAERLQVAGDTSWCCPIPVSHIGGMLVVLRGHLLGVPVDFSPDPLASKAQWSAIVPTQLARLVSLATTLEGRAFLVGGAALDPTLRERAEERGARVVTTYGMTETAGGVVYDGISLAGVEIRLDDESRISVRTPTLASALRRDTTDEPLADNDGWFRTRDLGAWDGDQLRVTGRADPVISTGAEKVDPAAVARIIRTFPKVLSVEVFGEPDPEWGSRLVARMETTSTIDLEPVRKVIRDQLGPAAIPKRFDIENAEGPVE